MNETLASSLKADALSALQAVSAGVDFADLRVGSQGVFWNEYRPEDAACRIWHWQEGRAVCLTPTGFSVRSRVYEYGGGSFCLSDGGVVFVNETDQQLYCQSLAGEAPNALTCGDCRYGDLQYSNGQVLAVEEQGKQHRLVAIDLQGGQRHLLAEGADFYAAPVADGDGQRLAWIEWDRPDQPWVATRLCQRKSGERTQVLAGQDRDQSLQQPRFDVQGRLWVLSDKAGWWQPWQLAWKTGRICFQ